MKTVYYFVISMPNRAWKQSPDYLTEDECWEAARNCRDHLAKHDSKRAEFCPINFCTKQVPAGA